MTFLFSMKLREPATTGLSYEKHKLCFLAAVCGECPPLRIPRFAGLRRFAANVHQHVTSSKAH